MISLPSPVLTAYISFHPPLASPFGRHFSFQVCYLHNLMFSFLIKLLAVPFMLVTCALFPFTLSSPLAMSQEHDVDFLHGVSVPKHRLTCRRDGWSTSSNQTLCPCPCSLQKETLKVGSQPPTKPLQIVSRTNCNISVFYTVICYNFK